MSLTIRVPATLANLGAGFDALGLAVDRVNTFSIEPSSKPGNGLIQATVNAAVARFGGRPVAVRVAQREAVPRSRGMGSSATARVAALLAYEALTGTRPAPSERLDFLADAEGHPDNVWPALLGGLVICGTPPRSAPIHPDLRIALCIPERPVSTEAARALLPERVPFADAVANARAAALLIAGLADGDLGAIGQGVRDRLHQPYREPLHGPVREAFAAARTLGAAPFVSGSGSTLAAFVAPGASAGAVADALAAPYRAAAIRCETAEARPRTAGAEVAEGP